MSDCGQCVVNVRRVAELEEDLKQSKQDVNFVKTLWRQVQTEHADIGVIVNTVLDRVTLQNEERDNNVLLILQDKDNQIANLTSELSWCRSAVEREREEKETLQREWERKQDDLNELISELEEQVAVRNLQISNPIRQEREGLVEKLDEKKSSLEKQLSDMRHDLKSCVAQMDVLKKRHEEQVEENERLRSAVEIRRTEAQSHQLIISELKENVAGRREESALLKQKIKLAQCDAANALSALEKSDKALRSAQEELVESERSAHISAQQHQVSLEQLHSTIAQLESRVSDLVKQESETREECLRLQSAECSGCKQLETELHSQERELVEREKCVHIVSSVREKCADYLSRPLALQDIPDVVGIILADLAGTSADLDRSAQLVKQLQLNCEEKNVALNRFREVHDRRLDRMKGLQEQLSEVLDELKSLDKERWRELSVQFTELSQNPQPLRHEDSNTVWTDLQYYKKGCTQLKHQLDRALEELDQIKLQRVLDIDTFNAMKAAVLEDQQECEKKLRVANHQSVCGCNLQLEILREKIEELTEHTESLNSENIRLLAALQCEKGKVAKLEGCVCNVQDNSTQTLSTTVTTVSTLTDNLAPDTQVREKGREFSNTLSLLNQLTSNRENIPPSSNHSNQISNHGNQVTNSSNLVSNPGNTVKSKAVRKRAVCCKTVGIQTLSKPPVKVLQKAPAALKIRMASLNQQVAVLTKAKNKHSKEISEEVARSDKLETQLNTTLRQLSSAQRLVQTLNEDVRTANEEANTLRDQMREIEETGLRQSELVTLQEKTAEIRKLTHHNNLLTQQISKVNNNIAVMEKEAEEQGLCVLKLEDKLCKSEKLVKQQRNDNETIRRDLTSAKSNNEQLINKSEDISKRLKKVQEVSDNRKNYIDTLKSQLSNAKASLDQVSAQCVERGEILDARTRELKNLTRKLQAQEKLVLEQQVLASRQLEDQGKEFSVVEASLNKKLTLLSKRNLEWEKCIRQAVGNIVEKIKQEKDKRVVASSLSSADYDRARHLSSSLLQLSEADFHDIMSSTRVQQDSNHGNSGDSASSTLSDTSVWRGQLAKILSLDDFGPVLANSLLQLFQEFARVISGETSSTFSERSSSQNSVRSNISNHGNHTTSAEELTPVRLS